MSILAPLAVWLFDIAVLHPEQLNWTIKPIAHNVIVMDTSTQFGNRTTMVSWVVSLGMLILDCSGSDA